MKKTAVNDKQLHLIRPPRQEPATYRHLPTAWALPRIRPGRQDRRMWDFSSSEGCRRFLDREYELGDQAAAYFIPPRVVFEEIAS